MRYSPPLIDVRFVRRYKRFFADVIYPDGTEQTVFCPNPGSMRSCLGEGWPARLSDSGENSKRKLRYSLEMLHNGRCWIGVNTLRANQLAEEALPVTLWRSARCVSRIAAAWIFYCVAGERSSSSK